MAEQDKERSQKLKLDLHWNLESNGHEIFIKLYYTKYWNNENNNEILKKHKILK